MQLMQVGWLGDENGDWAELRFGFGSSNQVQGTVLFAPRSSTEASDVDGVRDYGRGMIATTPARSLSIA